MKFTEILYGILIAIFYSIIVSGFKELGAFQDSDTIITILNIITGVIAGLIIGEGIFEILKEAKIK